MLRNLTLLGTIVGVLLIAVPTHAQSVEGAKAAVSAFVPPTNDARDSTTGAPGFFMRSPPPSLRRYAAITSLILPGSGQYLLGNDRLVGYLAVEVLAWWKYSKDNNERVAREREFKELARRVSRAPFPSTFPDSGWLYYEWMRDDLESGQFSLSSTGPTVPETDAATRNGKRWALAQATQPTYEAALAQYEREAIRPEYRWSWRDAQLQWDIYKRLTDKRNDAARAARADLIVIGANHFLSMIDAFATLRLQTQSTGSGRRRSVGASFKW